MDDEDEVLVCPMLNGSLCLQGNCGWWMADKCAVLAIADLLPTVLADLVTQPAEDPPSQSRDGST